MKKFLFIVLMLSLAVGGYLAFTTIDSKTPVVVAAKKTYSGTLYVAGMGGHFAVVDVTIDPNDTNQPIKVNDLEMMSIGNKKTHPTHDPRIDVNDRSIMYWSTYKLDPDGNLHVGKSNLNTGDVIKDVALPKAKRAKWTGANYCGSGQTEKSFIPVSMANEGYIDVFDKKSLELKHRLYISDLGYKPGTFTFAHGINTPNMKKFLLIMSLTPTGPFKWTGNTELIMLDAKALENGKFKVLAKNTITGGVPGKTIGFRLYFSQDGRYIFQSAADRGYLIDAKTLKVLDEETEISGANHDIMPTPDGRYAIFTLREKVKDSTGKESVDGTLQLYDVEARKIVGKSTSVCKTCHDDSDVTGKAILCGIDANWR